MAPKTYDLSNDEIVVIPKQLEKRLGAKGRMLRPSQASVEALVARIPEGVVVTTTSLRQALAKQHRADTTCPFLTRKALLAIAHDGGAPYWRVVMGDGGLLNSFPGGCAGQARRLQREGVRLTPSRQKVARDAVFGSI
jgi:alkylated DNA nucleotide flippase Atl1